jgi:hypothetical protein
MLSIRPPPPQSFKSIKNAWMSTNIDKKQETLFL